MWGWDGGVSKVVGKKRSLWKAWKKGSVSNDEYLVAKLGWAARHVVYTAKKAAEEKKFRYITQRDTRPSKLLRKWKGVVKRGKVCFRWQW